MTADSARIWFRVRRPGRYTLTTIRLPDGQRRDVALTIEDSERDNVGWVELKEDLLPNTRYRLALHQDPRQPLATGRFVTAPAHAAQVPRHFSIALMSCHQPFAEDGEVSAATEPMLEAVNRVLQEHHVRTVVMCGDQLYSDYPVHASLLDPAHFRTVAPPGREHVLDCTAAEVRRLFHQRYRHFWNIQGWRTLLASYPCLPILDDHEVIDNWGSVAAHSEQRWQAFREGAFQAYADYQGARVSDAHAAAPDHFDYQAEFGDVALYVMDLRSNRRVGEDPRLVAPEQLASLERFLRDAEGKSVVFLVLSVPLLHLPRRLARLLSRLAPGCEDFADRWSTRGHCRDRDEVLRMLHAHGRRRPRQRVVLLSGDIHIGCLHRITWADGVPGFFQFVSSGITHDAGILFRGASRLLMSVRRRIAVTTERSAALRGRVSLVRGEADADRNPCGCLNVGIVELTRPTPTTAPTLRFLLYSHAGSQPLCVYRSPPLTARVGRGGP